MQDNLKHKDILIIKAKEDLDAAKKLFQCDGFSEEIILFHCQQATEKALKAYLDLKNISYPKSHDLETLLSLCVEGEPSFKTIEFITSLTSYAVDIRYDEFVELPKEEISEILKQTENALEFILKKIGS